MASDRRVQLERRRRRILREDLSGTTPSCQDGESALLGRPSAGHSYTDAARADRQPRITDLIPRKPIVLLIIVLCGLTVIAGIETLYAHRTIWTRWVASTDLASLDLSAPGSLASWFSSLTLLCAAAYAVLVFTIRRHKLDDYRGRYGLWLWAMFGCLIASVDSTASLHQTLRGVLVATTGTLLVGDGSIWWIGIGACFFGVVAARVLLDMRGCPGACVAFGLAVNCYLLATMAHFGFAHFVDHVVTVMLHSAILLLGHLMLLFSFLVYARYVFLDAQGQIVSTEDAEQTGTGWRLRLFAFGGTDTAAADAEDEETESGNSPSVRLDLPSASQIRQEKKGTPSPTPTGESESRPGTSQETNQQPELLARTPDGDKNENSPQQQDASHRSKAERRRLRKLQRRQDRAA